MRSALLPSLAALALVLLAGSALAAPGPLGGECDGLVDVDCDDYYEDTSCQPGACPPEYEGRCLVWYTYLDTTLAPEHRPYLCEDRPYQ